MAGRAEFVVHSLDGGRGDRNSPRVAKRVAAEDDVFRLGAGRSDGIPDLYL